jgi:pimeloyl-ACP methyl ester carboxylesterase
MTTFVLVPGAWLGGWAWDDVAARLRAAGHETVAVTLTGLAERADEAGPEVDLDTHIADVTSLLDERDLRDVVLVGHSYGGIVVTGVADRRPERVARAVFIDSSPVPAGLSLADFGTPADKAANAATVAAEGDGWRFAPRDWDPVADPHTLAGLDETALATLRERSTDHPYASMTQPITLTGAGAKVPVTAVCCTFPLEAVHQMIAAGNPFFATLTDATLVALPTGHWPMFSRPEQLTTILVESAG